MTRLPCAVAMEHLAHTAGNVRTGRQCETVTCHVGVGVSMPTVCKSQRLEVMAHCFPLETKSASDFMAIYFINIVV